MISEDSVFVQLAQVEDYICIVELACLIDASVAEVRQGLNNLGDRVENNGHDQWRVVRTIASQNLLSKEERLERDHLEKTVQQAFVIAGESLKILRDKRLYRETHHNFESYVKDRFDFSKRNAYYLIDAVEVVNNLKSEQFVHSTLVLPTTEFQCRPLTKLPPEQQREVWRAAVEKAKGKVPSARIVKEIVNKDKSQSNIEENPTDKEIVYKPGTGIDYVVHLDEETYFMLQAYQDRIGTATKRGAFSRLLEDAIAK